MFPVVFDGVRLRARVLNLNLSLSTGVGSLLEVQRVLKDRVSCSQRFVLIRMVLRSLCSQVTSLDQAPIYPCLHLC